MLAQGRLAGGLRGKLAHAQSRQSWLAWGYRAV